MGADVRHKITILNQLTTYFPHDRPPIWPHNWLENNVLTDTTLGGSDTVAYFFARNVHRSRVHYQPLTTKAFIEIEEFSTV